MPITVDNEEFLNTDETMAELGVSRQHFYVVVRPFLRIYRFDMKKKPWFKRADVLALKTNTAERTKPPIVISGLFRDWTSDVRSMGYQVNTLSREIEIVSLDAEQMPATFEIRPYQQFVKRSRISFINQQPICIWATYYPLELVEDDILDEMKADPDTDVVKRIAEVHGLAIGWARDRYSARLASLEEQEVLQLLRDEPVMILQRASFTQDKSTLVLYSDMTLLGAWFSPEHEYPVHIWQPGPAQKPARTRTPASDTPAEPPPDIPPGSLQHYQLARRYGVHDRTFRDQLKKGLIPAITRPKLNRPGENEYWLSPAQQAAALDFWKTCGTPHTLPLE